MSENRTNVCFKKETDFENNITKLSQINIYKYSDINCM